DGMKVLDAGVWRPVPHATQLLADLGAEVLKIEPPGGDPMRTFPLLFRDIAGHKRSIELDLRSDAGRARALELARDADVFTEGWRPGVAARLGLSCDDVRAQNPSIIYCSISGYGQGGPLVNWPGHDISYQAFAGALAPRHADDAPAIPRLPVADLGAGTVAALCICAAWAHKLRTGEGEHIDVSMTDVVATWSGPRSGNAVRGRTAPTRGSAGYGAFACADGRYLTLSVISEDHFWQAVCDGLSIAALRNLSHGERLDRFEECQDAVAAACATLERDDAVDRLARAGAPVAPVLTPEEMAAHPQFRGRGIVVDADDGSARLGFPAVLRDRPARPPGPIPEINAHPDGW
ncbi:MAG TPA: CoA transferase, partial [Acidimicrobiia bacterium]|nr:CoA transferase [Acidimicrobiia bacterium]